MRRPVRSIDDAAARIHLASFLYSCRPAMLDAATVPELQRRYGLSAKLAEYHLTVARQKRGGEPR